jgi:hypothetical protein
MAKILFSTLTHGNEIIGLDVVKKIKKIERLGDKFDYIISNSLAFSNNSRYVDSDLNRIFPGNDQGNYEEQRAVEIINIGKKYDYVIDLHGSVSNTGVFIIITKLNIENLLLALRFNIKRIVIWLDTEETKGSLSTFMPIGIEIESGFKNDFEVYQELKDKLITFLERDAPINLEDELRKRDIFWVDGSLSKKNKKFRGLKNWKKIKDFYPLFVDGQYENIWCYKLKKVNLKIKQN